MARRLLCVFLSCCATLGLTSANADPAQDKGWSVVMDWSAGKPFDASEWTFEKGFVRNQELQYYAGQSPANFQITPDGLNLIARNESIVNANYRRGARNWREARAEGQFTSASLVSKQAWENVKIEIVASVRGGAGTWPAIWLKGPNTRGFSEVDMMEHIGRKPNRVYSTVHFGQSLFDKSVKAANLKIADLQGKDVTYSAELKPETLSVSVDGAPVISMERSRSRPWVRSLHQPFNLVINLALGGEWAGPVKKAALPASMTIKSIRIWEWRPGHENEKVTASKE